jgi:hypothetical protein
MPDQTRDSAGTAATGCVAGGHGPTREEATERECEIDGS